MLTDDAPRYMSLNPAALIVHVRHCAQGLGRTTCNEQGYAGFNWHREQLSGSAGFIKVDRTGLAFMAGSPDKIYLEAKRVDDPTPMTGDHSPRILIADDHTLLAEACKSFLEPEFQVVGIVTTGRELLRVVGELKPDVIVIDVGMPQLNGLDAAEQLRQLQPSCKIVFLTMNMSPDVAAEAFRRGALGYVVKSSTANELTTAIRRALKSESYLSPVITEETVDFLLRSKNSQADNRKLTRRQNEILQLLAEGMSMKEVANVLNLKPGTVAFHKYNLMHALGLKTNADLLRYAIKHHLVS